MRVPGATSVSMSMDRRSAAAAIGAGIIAIPQISEAKSSDFPKVKMAPIPPKHPTPFGTVWR